MRILHLAALAIVTLPVMASASVPVSVQVIGSDGRPLAGAVVTVTMPATAAPVARGPYSMAQRNISFDPHILIVPVGATVTFPNFDKVRHHVYSFSPAKKFELKLFGREENRSIVFDKPGAVTLGCNIHDQMSGLIYVTASPYTTVTGADGRAQFSVMNSASGTVAVWHPSIRGKDNTLSKPITVSANGTATAFALRR